MYNTVHYFKTRYLVKSLFRSQYKRLLFTSVTGPPCLCVKRKPLNKQPNEDIVNVAAVNVAANPGPSNELTSSEILASILKDLKTKGKYVMLRKRSFDVNNSAVSSFLERGIPASQIIEFFAAHPEHLAYDPAVIHSLFETLMELGMTPEQVVQCLAVEPEILLFDDPVAEVDRIHEYLLSVGITGPTLLAICLHYPHVYTNPDPESYRQAIDNMAFFFNKKDLHQLLRRTPQILGESFDLIEERYEYIYYEMGLEPHKILRSKSWWRRPLDFIQMRHEFLTRTGSYIRPHPKKPTISEDNPNLAQILDSNGIQFALKIAGVSVEEYDVFRDMYRRQVDMKVADWDDLDEDEIEDIEKEVEDGEGFDIKTHGAYVPDKLSNFTSDQ